MLLRDPDAEHQIQLHFLGNSHVYVTCNCIVRQHKQESSSRSNMTWNERNRKKQHSLDQYSLGDFPMGTPVEELYKAYNRHLDEED